MLEIKNITKVYRAKKAQEVVALDNVSINFGDTGLVFLLGKSGSGKSTLLNAIGGLDAFDNGEIIINGKSSNFFKQKDFDAYRNTYVGFIFQEYNILNDFTVEKNIGLALELQGKKADVNSINELLDQVDLKGMNKRKPNQLSGGQKQRIAIARALIKNPQIIMADEPTGALDSKTGRQVFETLKKLSENKLVIVVSHDRESAEIYADRIIELKDGKVIYDRVKKEVIPKPLSPHISIVQNNLLHVKGGDLTIEDRKYLDHVISRTKGDIFISSSENINTEIRRTAKINENNASSILVDTKNEDIKTNGRPKEFKLIKAKVKQKDCIKMGASSLRAKKGKLVVLMILSIFAMALFGFADTMACFDSCKNMYQTIQASSNKTYALQKVLYSTNYGDSYGYDRTVDTASVDVDELKEKYPNHEFIPVFTDRSMSMKTKQYVSIPYVYMSIDKGVCLQSSQYSKFGLELQSGGAFPTQADEVAITLFEYELYKKFGYVDESNVEHTINSQSDLIGKKIGNDYKYTITGIIDTKFDSKIQNSLFENVENPNYNVLAGMNLEPILKYGFHLLFFYGQKPEYANILSYAYVGDVKLGSINSADEHLNLEYYIIGDYYLKSDEVRLKNNSITKLNYNQVIAAFSVYQNYGDYYVKYFEEETKSSTEEEAKNKFYQLFNDAQDFDRFNNSSFSEQIGGTSTYFPFEVVGVYCDDQGKIVGNWNGVSLLGTYSKKMGNSIAQAGEYSFVITRSTGDKEDKNLIYASAKYDSKDDRFMIQNEASGVLQNFYSVIKTMAQVFLYIGIAFAVFATLLIMSFIGNSISYKKKEIGILRALGATGHDVYRIFTWESLIICGIIFIFSILLVGVGSFVVNMLLKAKVGLYLSLLSFGLRQILLVGGISLFIGLIASFLPTRKISKMKPIDAIQERK